MSLALVVVVCLVLAWSLDDARWVLGREAYTDFLSIAAIGGALTAFAASAVGLSRWPTYLVGSLVAAVGLPILIGSILAPDAGLVDQIRATALSVGQAWIDLALLGKTVTQEFGHYLLSLGLFVWATSMFVAYSVFGHRRPIGGVVLVGAILVGDMWLTANDQLPHLVLFTVAALALIVRSHALDERSEWLRRRIGDPSTLTRFYLRGGTAFIASAVIASLLLTQAAASAPLAGAWKDIGDGVIEMSRGLQRFLPTGGSNRSFGVSFGDTAPISGVWTTDSRLAVTIELAPTETRDFYWRAIAYDEFALTAWSVGRSADVPREARTELMGETAEAVSEDGRRSVTFTVIPEEFRDSILLSPATPLVVDVDSRVSLVGADGWFSSIDRERGRDSYALTALVPVFGDADPLGLTENRLRAAGTDYPAEVEALYLDVPAGAIPVGGDAERLLADLLARSPDDNPYDIARTMESVLRSSRFRYDTDVRDLPCVGLSTVECFARYETGYCQYYATTMAVLLRAAGIPARFVEGFLPGDRDEITGLERINMSSAHAWVEVYFPGYGWHLFDPTGGGLARTEPLPLGAPVETPATSATPVPAISLRPEPSDRLGEEDGGILPPGAITPGGDSTGPLIAVALVLLILLLALGFIAWQRGPRGPVTPDGAYGMITRLAARLGFAPRPTQTVYEYAGALGEVIPTARPDLQTVARAKVEVAYGKRMLGEDRMQSIREAERRLRVSLLRLLFVRGKRRRR